ncbi:hypothetical protein DPMN_103884 [Dreissena polymorpha]|uniref:Uncharacterized protein n=1 Tax=Dreissena polymorpha TaxID=45954 RepID=A0A9D4HBZ4_DREPO|nr:hypothetical protein DPMN_103884 [Dreissena polymorpha]
MARLYNPTALVYGGAANATLVANEADVDTAVSSTKVTDEFKIGIAMSLAFLVGVVQVSMCFIVCVFSAGPYDLLSSKH